MARLCALLSLALILIFPVPSVAANLATASSQDLLAVYQQLRSIHAGNQTVVAENVAFKRDAATFTFVSGRLTFAAPVAGQVVAAYFKGRGAFELDPSTPADQHQISRFTKSPKLVDSFQEAVFFFTDDSYSQLQKLVNVKPGSGPDAGAALAGAEQRYSHDYNAWIYNERKGNPEMRNLAARMLADISDPSSKGFFLADIKTARYGDLLFHISWNRDSLLLPGLRNSDEVMLLHVDRGNYYEWWSGFHLADEYAHSAHPEHERLLVHCTAEKIDADVTRPGHLSATSSLAFEVPKATARVVPFNLLGTLRISSITDGSGQKLAFIQEDRKLDSDPWLILPAPAKPGQTYKINVAYQEDSTHDSHVVYQRGPGLYYVTAREEWYPSFDNFNDHTEFELHFRSPKKLKFVATGTLVSSKKNGDVLETEWKSEVPLSVAGFNYGDFVEHTDSSHSLDVTAYAGRTPPDELRNLSSQIDVAQLAVHNRVDVASELGVMTGGFSTAQGVKLAAGLSFQAFELYDYYFGPLPFKSIAVTEQPIRGYGQSWPTLIFLPYDSLLDGTTRNSLHLQETASEREFYNIVAVHEMAHQWWGHLVGWKSYHDVWLSEGFAEFSAALYLARFEPNKWDDFWALKRQMLLEKNRLGKRPADVGPIWLGPQVSRYLVERNSIILTYDKGAYVLEMLRMLMRDPHQKNPDSRFVEMMRDFASTYAGKNASTADFERIVEKHMGEPMDWFFNEWVYGREVPTYDFHYQLDDAGNGKTKCTISIQQSGVSDSFRMGVPFSAVIRGKTKYLGMVTLTGSKMETGSFTLPVHPEKLVLDPDHTVLAVIHQ